MRGLGRQGWRLEWGGQYLRLQDQGRIFRAPGDYLGNSWESGGTAALANKTGSVRH